MRLVGCGMLVVLFLAALGPALAEGPQYSPTSDPNFYGWHPASVDIGGQHILTFRVGAGKVSPAERRAMLEYRLTKALSHTEYRRTVTMSYQKVPYGIAIYANGIYYLTVTPADAKACKSTLRGLAEQWGRHIKRVFEIVGPARQLPHTAAVEPSRPIKLE